MGTVADATKDIQLTDVMEQPAKALTSTVVDNVEGGISFCTHVGWDGVLLMLFCACISGLFILITSFYTRHFQSFTRLGIWLFLVFAVIYVLCIVLFVVNRSIRSTCNNCS